MNWTNLWLELFGVTQWHGIDLGFWVAIAAVAIMALGMNVFFWSRKPRKK